MRMNQAVASIVALAFSASIAYAGGNTAFNYQGRLLDGGQPANGMFDFEFELWDAANGGNTIGLPQGFNNTPVTDGLFTVQIDFGANAFTNADRWLGVTVNTVLLSPRQPVTRVPYAIQTRGVFVNDDQRIGIGTVAPSNEATLHIQDNMGDNFGVLTDSFGVVGSSIGLHVGPSGYSSLAKNAFFATGWMRFEETMGAYLQEIDPNGNVFFGVTGPGVNPIAWNPSLSLRTDGRVLVGRSNIISGQEYFGIHAPVESGFGGMYISTDGEDARPFYGYSAGGNVDAYHYYDGITGKWHLYNGGEQLTVQFNGNVGIGTTNPSDRLHVVSAGGDAIRAETSGALDTTVFSLATGNLAKAFWGISNGEGGCGVHGQALGFGVTVGVRGSSSSSLSGRGVWGDATADGGITYGVFGSADSSSGFGVFSSGNCHVNGTLSKSGGAFKIDHPLDPENKYLQHSFVESPDMMNVYNGNVILDENGRAYVGLPDYFDGLNRDFRYQLTPMGAAMPNLHIGEEIANNSFRIAGGKAGMKVSWQVTGIRLDPWAEAHRIEVEPYKRPEDQGKYLNPELYGQPKEMAVHYFPDAEHPVKETALAKAQAGPTPNPSTGEMK